MANEDWQTRYQNEMRRGRQARAAGNEGMARVCARRAAGAVIREYYRRQGMAPRGYSALNALKDLAQSPRVPDRVREIAAHFVWPITQEHTLPGEADLLAEAEWLRQQLLEKPGLE